MCFSKTVILPKFSIILQVSSVRKSKSKFFYVLILFPKTAYVTILFPKGKNLVTRLHILAQTGPSLFPGPHGRLRPS